MDIEQEEWKTIEGFGRYEIGSLGNLKNVNTGKLNKGHIDGMGYLVFAMKDDENKPCARRAHILVAKAFVTNENPETKNIVNHKDEIKSNPRADNLEWTTRKENANHGTNQQRIGMANSKPVNEYDIDGKYIRTWQSTKCVEMVYPITSRNIQRAATIQVDKGKQINQTAYGRQWRYLRGNDIGNIKPAGKYVRKYNKDANHNIEVPEEYLYTAVKLTKAESYAEKIDEVMRSQGIQNCFIADLRTIKEYLLKQCVS